MKRSNRELWYVFLALILITVVYILFSNQAEMIPTSSSLFGHVLGVIGFVLMLFTAFVYSIRKKSRRAARWGRMESWLKFHIFTGIVGPYMVFLHTSWSFRGMAGVATLLTAIIVVSGFIGRYIYTLIPRTLAGIELADKDLEYYRWITEAKIQNYLEENPAIIDVVSKDLISTIPVLKGGWLLPIRRLIWEWRVNRQWQRETRGIKKEQQKKLKKMIDIRRDLQYQIVNLLQARRMLALWHTVHVPIVAALFITSFVHIGATIYYVSLAK